VDQVRTLRGIARSISRLVLRCCVVSCGVPDVTFTPMPRPRILVADDHADARQRIADLLGSEFDVVATVADGQAAVDAATHLQPDVVVLDISMPVLNGFEAASRIGLLPAAPRIVFATTYDHADFSAAALERGGSALVLKQNMLAELVPAVRGALKFHAVCFYEDAASLSRTVAGFVEEGVAAGQPAVVIATAPHRAIIFEQLIATGIDADRRMTQGELVMLDADELLTRFMVDDMPDMRRFENTVSPIVAAAAGTRQRFVRAYGEMVDVLWTNHNPAAAMSLERLWNHLIARTRCSLLCGYSLNDVGQGAGYGQICDQHSHVWSERG
jgi:CheY-like chemotaxis protein